MIWKETQYYTRTYIVLHLLVKNKQQICIQTVAFPVQILYLYHKYHKKNIYFLNVPTLLLNLAWQFVWIYWNWHKFGPVSFYLSIFFEYPKPKPK